jgi:hypothetical protein
MTKLESAELIVKNVLIQGSVSHAEMILSHRLTKPEPIFGCTRRNKK